MTYARIRAHHPYYAEELGLAEYSHILRGVYVGSCVHERNAWGIWDGVRSHAHNYRKNEWFGWVCVLKAEDVLTSRGKPTTVLLHELAHLAAPESLHSRAWKRAVTELGAGTEIARCHLTPL